MIEIVSSCIFQSKIGFSSCNHNYVDILSLFHIHNLHRKNFQTNSHWFILINLSMLLHFLKGSPTGNTLKDIPPRISFEVIHFIGESIQQGVPSKDILIVSPFDHREFGIIP